MSVAVQAGPSTTPRTHKELALSVLGVVLAALSPLALVAEKYFDVSLHDSVHIVVLPAAFALLALGVWSWRTGPRRLGACLLLGLAIGLPATGLYDALRLTHVIMAGTSDEAQALGTRILDRHAVDTMGDNMAGDAKATSHDDMGSPAATSSSAATTAPSDHVSHGARMVAGYAYHYWNGVATLFLLIFGKRRPWLAIPFMGLAVYGGMLAVMGIEGGIEGFAFELAGHLAFGALLAVGAHRYLHRSHAEPLWRLAPAV